MCPVLRVVVLLESQAVVAWRISYSTGVSMPRDEYRRCWLWKISRYSKMASLRCLR